MPKWFNYSWTQGILPSSLKSLYLGYYFDQPLLPGMLPTSLTSLELGRNFNQELPPGVLPASLKVLIFERYCLFNRPLVPGSLPDSLTRLEIGENFSHPIIAGTLPSSLTTLTLGMTKEDSLVQSGQLPDSINTLCLGPGWTSGRIKYPQSLTSLKMSFWRGSFNKEYPLPPTLQTLVINNNKTIPSGTLPESITSLDLGYSHESALTEGVLPSNIKMLKMGHLYKLKAKETVLPDGLTHLEIDRYRQLTYVPKRLEYLHIHEQSNAKFGVKSLSSHIGTLSLRAEVPKLNRRGNNNRQAEFMESVVASIPNVITYNVVFQLSRNNHIRHITVQCRQVDNRHAICLVRCGLNLY
ncbi:hypothetical protein SAMD00019534_025140, partial [Acytostelium subglobosum LB1]|uniref:hypothetical protein n=1 Tax=Acytostelium subglobosum LB1 TaxID=1410327 RepID=UPI000644EBFC